MVNPTSIGLKNHVCRFKYWTSRRDTVLESITNEPPGPYYWHLIWSWSTNLDMLIITTTVPRTPDSKAHHRKRGVRLIALPLPSILREAINPIRTLKADAGSGAAVEYSGAQGSRGV